MIISAGLLFCTFNINIFSIIKSLETKSLDFNNMIRANATLKITEYMILSLISISYFRKWIKKSNHITKSYIIRDKEYRMEKNHEV